jgi:sugar/nucleoside kinase (ribokinase family)
MGAEGSLLYRPAGGECWHVGAVPVAVVDPVGAGNAYCGALLVGWLEHGDLAVAGQYATVAASFLVEQYGLPQPSPRLRQQAAERLALAKVTRMELPPRGATLNREAS